MTLDEWSANVLQWANDRNLVEGSTPLSQRELLTVHAAAIEVLRKSHHGDQHFINCLRSDDAKELRLALVELAEAFRVDLD